MSFAFKKFSFFQHTTLRTHAFPANATCHAEGARELYVGCDNGSVHALEPGLQQATVFSAHGHKVLHMRWLPRRKLLVTLGVEEPGISSATVKIWDLNAAPAAQSKAGGASSASSSAAATAQPQPLRSARVFGAKHSESEVTTLAAHESSGSTSSSSSSGIVTVAVGLAAGYVHLFTADLSSKGAGKFTQGERLAARPEHGDLWAVYGLEFSGSPDGAASAANGGGGAAAASGGSGSGKTANGKTAAAAGGSGASRSTGSGSAGTGGSGGPPAPLTLFVVTESQTLAFNVSNGTKTILDAAGVRAPRCCMVAGGGAGPLVVARDDALYEYTADGRGGCAVFEGRKQLLAGLGRYLMVVTADASDIGVSTSTVSLVDVRNKMVAGALTLPHVRHVVPAAGRLAVLLGSGDLVVASEVPLAAQLDALFKRSLYKLAADLATASDADAATLAAIHQRWGDHLYAKGDYDGALVQYVQTLGQLEPSYAIRKLLEAQRIEHLTAFLEALHEEKLATADHTTLLLNCYAKLKDVDKLDAFIQRGARGGPSFDMETAYKVLRSAGYRTHALWVAERAGQPDWLLELLLEEGASYEEALAYLDSLPRRQAAEALKKYGPALVAARPEDVTRLLMDLCSPGTDLDGSDYVASVADFAHLFTEKPAALTLLCEFALSHGPDPPQRALLYHTLLELYLAPVPAAPAAPAAGEAELQSQPGSSGSDASAGPRDQAGSCSGSSAYQALLPAEALSQEARRAKALELLQSGWPPHAAEPAYECDTALVLCRVAAFSPGLVFLLDRRRLHREVLQVHMAAGDHEALIQAVVKYGDIHKGGDPQLWMDVLEYFATAPGDCTEQVAEVLEYIEDGGLIPPLLVLQTLAQSRTLTVALVRGYVARQLAAESAEIQRSRDAIQKLQAETAQMKVDAQRLRTQPRVVQNNKCSISGAPLELPAVHFMCGHSFNLRSLGDSDRECPLCAPEHRRVLDIQAGLKATAGEADAFFTQLRENNDGFAVVAEHFGRGLMNMTAYNQQQAARQQQTQQHGSGAPSLLD